VRIPIFGLSPKNEKIGQPRPGANATARHAGCGRTRRAAQRRGLPVTSTNMKTSDQGDASGVPQLSSNDIELKAEEVIEFFDRSLLSSYKPTPIRDFALKTKQQFGIEFRTDLDLGFSSPGRKCLGKFRIKPRAIFVDASLDGTERFPFVLAHEYAHLVLHRKIDPLKSGYSTSSIDDTEFDFATGKKILMSPRDWIEWQANRFASAILMPRRTFSGALIDYHKSQNIRRNIGIVVVNKTQTSQNELRITVSHLAIVYGVNRTNVECRLRDLELLQDHRNPGTRHISELLKEE
jgi:Zn-dependent peptidase ImmA (M78 family)